MFFFSTDCVSKRRELEGFATSRDGTMLSWTASSQAQQTLGVL